MEQTTLSVCFKDNELKSETTRLSRRMRRRSGGLMDSVYSCFIFLPHLCPCHFHTEACSAELLLSQTLAGVGALRGGGVRGGVDPRDKDVPHNFHLQGSCVSSLLKIQNLYLSKLSRCSKMTAVAMPIETVQNAKTTTTTKEKTMNFSSPIISHLYTQTACNLTMK